MSDERPPRPEPLAFDPEAVPEKLRDREQWVAWRLKFDTDRDEWTKVPVDTTTGRLASSTDPATWTTFGDAVGYHERANTNTDGVGFVFAADDLTLGIDLDDCRDPETGDLEAWAADVVDTIGTYWEVSPSGTGLHAFGFGIKPDGKTRADVDGAEGHIEMYDSGRFFTVTGRSLDDVPADARQVNDAIADVHAEYIADPDPAPEAATPTADGGVDTRSPGANPGEDGRDPVALPDDDLPEDESDDDPDPYHMVALPEDLPEWDPEPTTRSPEGYEHSTARGPSATPFAIDAVRADRSLNVFHHKCEQHGALERFWPKATVGGESWRLADGYVCHVCPACLVPGVNPETATERDAGRLAAQVLDAYDNATYTRSLEGSEHFVRVESAEEDVAEVNA